MPGRIAVLSSLGFIALAIPTVEAQPLEPDAYKVGTPGIPKPWEEVRGFGRVLDLSKLPVVIDEPGLYALQRDWVLTGYQLGGDVIRITADGVTLDLHGFGIGVRLDDISSTLLAVTGNQVAVRNGRLRACCEGAAAFGSTGVNTRLEHVNINGQEPMELAGEGATITDSVIHARWGTTITAGSLVQRNTISCRTFCLTLIGTLNQVTDNRFSFGDADFVVRIEGDGNVVERNVIDNDGAPGFTYWITGDRNVVRGNTITGGGGNAAFVVAGTRNTLDGDIVALRQDGPPMAVGIGFSADGNYYGDNRMAATVPFNLNATVQTDWGGNVSY